MRDWTIISRGYMKDEFHTLHVAFVASIRKTLFFKPFNAFMKLLLPIDVVLSGSIRGGYIRCATIGNSSLIINFTRKFKRVTHPFYPIVKI